VWLPGVYDPPMLEWASTRTTLYAEYLGKGFGDGFIGQLAHAVLNCSTDSSKVRRQRKSHQTFPLICRRQSAIWDSVRSPFKGIQYSGSSPHPQENSQSDR
jgi:hypothetical protein